MSTAPKKKQARVNISRDGKTLAEYSLLQLPSLLETGHLKEGDLCLDSATEKWVPIREFMRTIPDYSRRRGTPLVETEREGRFSSTRSINWIPWAIATVVLVTAIPLGFLSVALQQEVAVLKDRVASAEAESTRWQSEYNKVLFAASEVAPEDVVRGRLIVRDTSGKRMSPPNVKVRLYPRRQIEEFLAERDATARAAGLSGESLVVHFASGLPDPMEISTTNSDGRFEFAIPEPGEYVIQAGVFSARNGQRISWFVSFDSRDPLNTPVDLTESNRVRQYLPLLMVVEGR